MDKQLKNKIETILNSLRNRTEDEIINFDIKDLFIDRLKEDTIIRMRNYVNEHFELGDMTPLKKICCYRISALKKGIDCDVSLFSIVIYALVFNIKGTINQQKNSKEKYQIKDEHDIIYIGDTMNSYAKTTRNYLREYYHNDEIYNQDKKYLKNEYFSVSINKNIKELTEGIIKQSQNHWEACILDNYNEIDFLLPDYIKEFLKICHSIGNMIPVPYDCFNSPRGIGPTNDYWDEALDAINEQNFEKIIGKNKDYIEKCEEWYSKRYQSDWKLFVKKTYMEPFVDKELNPISLYKRSFRLIPRKDEKYDGYEEFYTNVTKMIKERGKLIAKKLKEILDNNTNEEIIKEYFIN